MRRIAVLCLCAAIGGVIWFSFPSGRSRFIEACEKALLERLEYPSEYRRISADYREQGITIEQYPNAVCYNIDSWQFMSDLVDLPTRYTVVLEYSEPDYFGIRAPREAVCEYFSRYRSLAGVNSGNVMVNGQSWFDWIMNDLADRRNQTRGD